MKDRIVFIIVDALRADHLGCCGYDKPTSSNIDRVADKGVLFENAFSTTNATDPSLTSIFSGKYPASSGIRNHGTRTTDDEKRKAEGLLTLPKILRKLGYRTIGVNWFERWHRNGYHFYGISSPWHYRLIRYSFSKLKNLLSEMKQETIPRDYRSMLSSRLLDTKYTTRTALDFLKRYHDRRFLLYVHFWGTHTPYAAPKSFRDFFYKYHQSKENSVAKEDMLDVRYSKKWRGYLEKCMDGLPDMASVLSAYDAAVALVDSEIGRIYHSLCELKIADSTNLVITADHGESLLEHGIYLDHHGLYDESVHVPLIFSGPAFPQKKRIAGLVQHVDILPTFMDLLNAHLDKLAFDGFSLFPLLGGDVKEVRQFAIFEESYTEEKKAIRTKKWKYIFSPSEEAATCRYCNVVHGGKEELYDLELDPKEKCSLVDENQVLAVEFKKRLLDWMSRMERRQVRERLRLRIRRLKENMVSS